MSTGTVAWTYMCTEARDHLNHERERAQCVIFPFPSNK
eukprot:SAG22_NODE_15572_length_345_cov_1.422764_1_plen_37_part_01